MGKRRSRPGRRTEKTAAEPEIRRQSLFHPRALADIQHWIRTDPRLADRILELIQLTLRDPFAGKGKPELLKDRNGVWSRRINQEHRLTYRVTDEHIGFLQARYHYEK